MALAGCAIGKDVPKAESAIAAFHQAVDAGRFDGIYDASAQEIKGTTSRTGFTALLAAIHSKLGAFKSGRTNSWNDNYGSGGHVITIIYAAVYERGAAREEFVYKIDGGRAVLAGYHVNSNALLLH
jgi:hypothetical protein